MSEFDMAEAIQRHRDAMANGDHLFSELQMTDVETTEGDLAIELELTPRLAGPRGHLQGGLIATLADVVAGRLAMQGVADGGIVVTSDLTVHYLAPVAKGPAHAVGRVLRRGSRAAVVRVDVHDGRDGPLAAACTVAFKVVSGPGS